MLSLDSPIQVVPKIGPKYKVLLEKLGINTVEDLLYHFPFRYEDYSKIKLAKEILNGEQVTVKGVLGPVQNIFTRNGKKITKAEILDHTGKIQLIWFNQHYLKKVLESGKHYYVSGETTLFDNKVTIIGPEMELVTENSLHTGRLIPIYPETYGVSSKWLRTRINDVVSAKPTKLDFQEFIPENIKQTYKLMDLPKAIEQIHFPDDLALATNARHRFAFEELFIELLKVEIRKQDWTNLHKGKTILYNKKWKEEIVTSLPFTLTQSQSDSIDSIIKDLLSEKPMNRLLEGDVGAGKTIVAIVSTYLAFKSGQKTVYLAPTEILAKQHFNTYKTYFDKFGIVVGLATSTEKIHVEDCNVIVGTHALLHRKLLDETCLIIIDEQHRFGVEQRGKLVNMGKDDNGVIPNLLTLSATPIPRTLALTIYGDLDISILETPPQHKRQVLTKVLPDSERLKVYTWIAKQNSPTFVVCPLIDLSESETLENVKSAQNEFIQLQKFFPEKKMGLLHGRMKPEEKNKMIEDFTNGKIMVLVATPVIEVGIDIPDASIMVIESSERYGLASLHQLRGRIGRKGQQSHCFMFMSNFSDKSFTRLKHLESINDGLKLAELDLNLRGEGDVFSTLQHGYKKLRIASLTDLDLLEKAKKAAQEVFPIIDTYPLLQSRVGKIISTDIRNN